MISILSSREIGRAHLPSDSDILGCLRRLGVPESQLTFTLADEFIAPGVLEQYHFVAGHASTGVIKEEEEERGAGSGTCYYMFCKDRGLEIYLAYYSGNGGEIAMLVQADSTSADVCHELSVAMDVGWPTSPKGATSKASAGRLTIHQQRFAAMQGHVQKWFKP